MRKVLLLSGLLVCAAPVAATDSSHCDAVPFTLGKPAPSAPKVQPKANAKAATTMKTAEAKPKPQPKPRLYSRCDDPKAKKAP